MIIGTLILFGLTLAGVFIACKVFNYDIAAWRKAGAAGAFALLNAIPIPIPLIDFLLPAVVLYAILVDSRYRYSQVNKVFVLTFVFAVIGILVIYSFRQL